MAIIKEISIDGKKVPFSASAAIMRVYRARFGRDLFEDLSALYAELEKNNEEESSLSIGSLQVFEDIAYTMAKQADPAVPETPEEWLDGFNLFSIYTVLPQIVEMWKMSTATSSKSKKKVTPPIAR